MKVDHPSISMYCKFFMSNDYYFYISKLKLKIGHKKLFKESLLPSFMSMTSANGPQPKTDNLIKLSSSLSQKGEVTKFQSNLCDVKKLSFNSDHNDKAMNLRNQALKNHLQTVKPIIGIQQIETMMPKTLQQAIIDHKKSLTAVQIAYIAKELLLAIQFIHSKDIVHLDLSPENILVQRSRPEQFFNKQPISASRSDIDDSLSEFEDDLQDSDKSNILLINFC